MILRRDDRKGVRTKVFHVDVQRNESTIELNKALLNNPKEKVQTLSEIGQGLLFLSSSRLWITFCSKRI